MTPQQFIAKWGPGGPTPGSAGDYLFEQDTLVLGEARGYAADMPDEEILKIRQG